MSSSDEIHVVSVEELGDNVGAEGEGNAAVVLAPALDVLVGVGPEQVAEEARVRNVGWSHDSPDLLHRLRKQWNRIEKNLEKNNGPRRNIVADYHRRDLIILLLENKSHKILFTNGRFWLVGLVG